MTTTSTLTLYDLVTAENIPLSPWCWMVKMALAHKEIEVETIPLHFTQKDQVIAEGGKSFPFMIEISGDGSKQGYDDSRHIIARLEALKPDPTLFPGGAAGRAGYDFMFRYLQTIMMPTIIGMILVDIPKVLTPEDQAYFYQSREQRFGMSLDEFCQGRDAKFDILNTQLDPFRRAMAEGGFISGEAPAMADYALFGMLQWARVTSPTLLYSDVDVIHAWMEVMLDLFDGYGRNAKAFDL